MTFVLDKQLKADSVVIGRFKLCQLLLMNDSQYPWFTLVPMLDGKKEVYELSHEEQNQLWFESRYLSELIMKHFKGDKLNIAAIGNVVSQLHIHHVVRFKNDISWPKPIWGQGPMKRYSELDMNNISLMIKHKLLDCEYFTAIK
jgi:diadenosine tetraphosphate (Ap4A) HIT family hydrolase